jgi:hypothetical protein
LVITRTHRSHVLDEVDEKKARLIEPSAAGVPAKWATVLSRRDPRTAVLDELWKPVMRPMRRTVKELRRCLQGVELLATRDVPVSLIYFFTDEDGEPFFYRGFPPIDKPAEPSTLPKKFLEMYDVHDGWVDELGFMGPLRSEDWYPLGSDPKKPSGQFLVVFQNGGGAELGFDLRTQPHPCYTLQPGEQPQLNADPCGTIDAWIAGQLEDLKSSSE